jgi:hypothetical protein
MICQPVFSQIAARRRTGRAGFWYSPALDFNTEK